MRRSKEEGYQEALEIAQRELGAQDPYEAAYRAGCNYEAEGDVGRILVPFLGQELQVTFPGALVCNEAGQPADITTSLLVLHYLLQADGTAMADHWVAFRELPDGLAYAPAFQGRAAHRIREAFGTDPKGFGLAAGRMGGLELTFGDASFAFSIFPRLRMAVVLYVGDEEFGPAVNVLFDASAGHYLPTEDLAVLGGLLASRLLKAPL